MAHRMHRENGLPWIISNAVMIVRINYRGNSTPEYHYYAFNADVGDWQFLTGIVVPKQANQVISTIDVIAACDYCVNSAFVDDISLTKEPVQTYSYDEEGKLLASAQTDNGQSEYDYDSSDRLRSYTSLTGVTTTFTYTGNKRSPTTAKTDHVETTYTYDDSGNVQTTRTEGDGHDTAYLESSSVYSDDDNFRTQTTNVNGITSTASYAGRSGNTLTSTDANGTLTTYQYNSADRLTRSYITGLTSLTNTYVNGLLTAVSRTGHDNDDHAIRPQVYSMGYDAWGRTTSIKVGSAEGSGLTLASYTYAANGGHLTKTDYANGQSVEYTYDLFDRLIKEAYYNSSHVLQSSNNYVYNSQGVLCRKYVEDAQNQITEEYSLEYDSLGRLIRSKQTDGTSTLQSTEHLYDTANRLTKQSWQLGSTLFSQTYAYNPGDSSLNNTTTTGIGNIRFSYDALKRTRSQIITTKNNSYVFGRWLTYNDSGDRAKTQVSKIRYYAGDEETGSPFTGYTYTYWPDGNIKKIFDATTSQQIAAYEYDAQGQLLSESTPSGTCYYTYDTVGNLLTVQSGSNIVTYTYGDLQWHDRLTRIKFNDCEYAISYSGGNPLNWYNGSLYTNLTWGKDRQLVSLKKGTSTYSYSYDMDGVRKSKTVSGVTHNYLTQNGKVVQESYGTKVLQFVYDTAGAPYALRYSTDSGGSWYTFYYILNLQGDVVKLIYANGTACATYSYNAWGECSATTLSTSPVANIANINPLRYRGYYYDTETGFYYLQSRYYDPIVKRFLNADSFASTGQGFIGYNMFAYCNNNPIIFQDEDGDAPWYAILPDWGFVHRKVQDHIIATYPELGFSKECSVMFEDGRFGRIDLLDNNNRIIEIKFCGKALCSADAQLKRYLNSQTAKRGNYERAEYAICNSFTAMTRMGEICVVYFSVGEGVIAYDFWLLEQPKKKQPAYSDARAKSCSYNTIGTTTVCNAGFAGAFAISAAFVYAGYRSLFSTQFYTQK